MPSRSTSSLTSMRPSSGGSRRISKCLLPAWACVVISTARPDSGTAAARAGPGLGGWRWRHWRRRSVGGWRARRRRDFARRRRRLWPRRGVAARLRGRGGVGLGQEIGRGVMEFAGGLVAVAARLSVLAGVDLRHAGLRIGGGRRPLPAASAGLSPCAWPGFGAAFGATPPAACSAASASASGVPLSVWRRWLRERDGPVARPRRSPAGVSAAASCRVCRGIAASAASAALPSVGLHASARRFRRRRWPWRLGVVAGGAGLAGSASSGVSAGAVLGRLGVVGADQSAAFRRLSASGALGTGTCRGRRRRGRGAVEQIGERGGRLPARPAPDGCGGSAKGRGTAGRYGLRTRRWARRDLTLRNGGFFVCNRRASRGSKNYRIYINGLR